MTETTDSPSLWHQWLRLAWYPTAGLALIILIASIPGYLSMDPLSIFEGRVVLSANPTINVIFNFISLLSFTTASLSVGLACLLFVKKSQERIGLFLAYYLLIYGVLFAGPFEQLEPFWPSAPWFGSFVMSPFLIGPLTTALIGIFPDGRFIPPWFKWIVPLSLVIFPISVLGGEDFSGIAFTSPKLMILGGGIIVSVTIAVLQVYAQVYRYRNISTTLEKQQTKVVLYGVVLWFLLLALSSTAWIWGFSQPVGTPAPWWFTLSPLVWVLSTLVLPASLTIAVLRYKLFEIELLVNRTLVYGLLTGLLALVYFVLVTGLQNLFAAISGQQSALAIVISTLIIAVLFNPFRRRIQDFIDLRFYRRRYDPEKLLAAFNHTVRDEVDFERLAEVLLGMVEESMQPENASVWLQEVPERVADTS